jgi:uncharacterized protein (TIGR02145 family)
LKETGTSHWPSPNTGATNSSGFTALPGGYRNFNGYYYDLGYQGFWWSSTSSTESSTSFALGRRMFQNGANVFRNDASKRNGFSVRCMRD